MDGRHGEKMGRNGGGRLNFRIRPRRGARLASQFGHSEMSEIVRRQREAKTRGTFAVREDALLALVYTWKSANHCDTISDEKIFHYA